MLIIINGILRGILSLIIIDKVTNYGIQIKVKSLKTVTFQPLKFITMILWLVKFTHWITEAEMIITNATILENEVWNLCGVQISMFPTVFTLVSVNKSSL